jgi:transposase
MVLDSTDTKIFLCAQPVDLRRSFEGLVAIARDELRKEALSGHWFVFRNRRGGRLNILMWDLDGLLLVNKRRIEGKFPHAVLAPSAKSVKVTMQEVSLLSWGKNAMLLHSSQKKAPFLQGVSNRGPKWNTPWCEGLRFKNHDMSSWHELCTHESRQILPTSEIEAGSEN